MPDAHRLQMLLPAQLRDEKTRKRKRERERERESGLDRDGGGWKMKEKVAGGRTARQEKEPVSDRREI